MNKVQVGGKTYNVPDGARIDVVGNRILVDGKALPSEDVRFEEVRIMGNAGAVKSDVSVTVHGNVEGDVNCGGSFKGTVVNGSVEAGGSVKAECIDGSVSAGGSVKAGKIGA
jgi:hypothetical protein